MNQHRHVLAIRTLLLSSTRGLSGTSKVTTKERDDGAWAMFSALENAKEAQYVKVARLVSSLESLLPNLDGTLAASIQNHQQHRISSEHSSDPAFFSLPDIIADPTMISGDTVRTILTATRQGRRVDLHTIEVIVKAATQQFQKQPTVVMLPPLQENQQLTVVGDLHASLSDLEAALGLTGEPHRTNLLVFNGDLADRGDHGIEIIILVCALCLAYPDYVHVNRGNHEDLSLSIAYGLAAEVQHKYGASVFQQMLGPLLDTFFRSLPLATVVEQDAFIVHAGPPPPNVRIRDISKYMGNDNGNAKGPSRTIRTNSETLLTEQQQTAQEAVIEALLWSDPIIEEGKLVDYHETPNSKELGWVPNISRGAGYKYDASVVRRLLENEGLTRLIRSHEHVQKGCERYTISRDDTTANKKALEFFTVFSASRYPHKEGFNQGALLKLFSNGEHSVIRYATEEDESALMGFTSFDEENTCSPLCVVDSTSILRVLQGVAASHKPKLVDSLEQLAKQQHSESLPFREVGDIILRTLMLDEAGLDKSGARLALAKALSIQCHDGNLPETVDLAQCINALVPEEEDAGSVQEMAPYYPWLRAVFEMVDLDADGLLSREEWLDAVAKINLKLPPDTNPINAEGTWELLDLNGNGRVSSSEWDELGKALCR